MEKAIDGNIKRKKERKGDREIDRERRCKKKERDGDRDKLFNMSAYHSIDLLMLIVINISTYNNKRQISISQ